MAGDSKRRGSARSSRPHRRPATGTSASGAKKVAPGRKKSGSGGSAAARPASPPAQDPLAGASGPLRLGVVAGSTPGKWVDRWHTRYPHLGLDLTPLDVRSQHRALTDGDVDLAIVRLPIPPDGLHIIALYDESAVVVFPKDAHFAAADELTLADLAGEVHVTSADDPLGLDVPGAIPPRFDPPPTTEDAIATVGAGVGFAIVPATVARLARRRDVLSRPLVGSSTAPEAGDAHGDSPPSPGTSTVALAWRREDSDASPLIDAFVGIVRGRTANSSR